MKLSKNWINWNKGSQINQKAWSSLIDRLFLSIGQKHRKKKRLKQKTKRILNSCKLPFAQIKSSTERTGWQRLSFFYWQRNVKRYSVAKIRYFFIVNIWCLVESKTTDWKYHKGNWADQIWICLKLFCE